MQRTTRLLLMLLLVCSTSMAIAEDKQAVGKSKFNEKGHTVDSLDIVKKRLKAKEAALIDVREPAEWKQGHLEQANLVPLSAIRGGELTTEMKKALPKNKPIYLHCRSGGRVLIAFKFLKKEGYDIRPLQDGYEDLVEAGFKKAQEESAK
jgi:rhodanese-related sulfurtransferase